MNRWFRFYDDAINDPKILRLSDANFRAWVTLLCLASKNDGVLPPTNDIALVLRMKPTKVAEWLTILTAAGLLDCRADGTFAPHNWNARQYKSDVSTDRVQRFRKRKRNVSPAVSETAPETETETETEQKQNSEATASDADASDPRTRLFREGLAKIAAMSGKGPDSCRSFIGKCLKAADDNAVTVLGLIEDAERNRVVNPTAWIAARLKPQENFNGRRTVHQAADEALEKLRAFDEPAPSGLRDGTREDVVRLLPSR